MTTGPSSTSTILIIPPRHLRGRPVLASIRVVICEGDFPRQLKVTVDDGSWKLFAGAAVRFQLFLWRAVSTQLSIQS
ncbi:hypothetical protein BSN85_21785 [Bradyrhizobium brasilense]|nr:hypothetical protein BSN85_21785 [Bradyrhizobium brasilense]